MDAATVLINLKTHLSSHMYLMQRKDLQEKGWVGASPPKEYLPKDDLKAVVQDPEKVEQVPTIKELVGTSLHHVNEIFHMEKDVLIPKFNEDKCLKCGRCYLACADSGY